MCLQGRVVVTVDGDDGTRTFTLDDPSVALFVPPGVWSAQQYAEVGTMLLVLASDPFDPDDLISEPARPAGRDDHG